MLILIPVSLSAQKDVRKNIRKGNKEYKAQKYSDAASFYEKAIEENPTSNEANYNLGNTLYNQKEWDKAIEFYNNSNSAEGENSVNVSSAMHNIGNAMLRKKELNDAMEAYKMALRLNPEDDETRYNLAVVQKMIQDEEQQQDDGEDDQEQQQQEQQQDQQQSPQNQQDQEKRPEQPDSPEQMSRDNARALLQALEQDERETQEKVQQIKAQEREEQAQDNRRQNKNW
ncbi:MAG TPA: tetratricopeptide repeat protein [Fermentimonas sp.]|nr:tetratricopeptide repeat protein [Fermentimonas sp.]